ncbi:LysR substrate-binding domain-containing protein [Marinobacter xiaoshiensis]|uniref:LysR substrate-binding domain-containing protein n=1 Tax=Marinobacter xiaoshiensis TaxID=3073652 RepID=A0ABU2HDI6_9GAMM|nr:LysR substrate-binding domain-containing protein [Marinobacter sp. F60267]MDS1309145.1 LysR substrate-binding domain-containing protein [Marinobacter sp. F60267]
MLHLPLLNGLKTFVVAGSHLNFTRAADELLVSPSAISHQIRALEDYLGVKLFLRQNRALSLTPEGARLHQALEQPFDQIARAILDTQRNRDTESLRIALRPFFSGAWLAQRLNRFWGKWPQIRIDLIHTIKMMDFNTENIDLEILWGKGDWPDLEAKMLVPGNLTPICSAGLIEEQGRPVSPADLTRYTLIHDEDHSAWGAWVDKANAGPVDFSTNLTIDDTNVRLQSILNNQGIMLGCPALLREYLSDGRLVQLFDISLDTYSYYLVYPKNFQLTKNMQIFVDWLLAETDADHM